MEKINRKDNPVIDLPDEMTPRTSQLREMLMEKAKGKIGRAHV